LQSYNKTIEKCENGIYYIHDEWIPIQIIVQSELEKIDENYPVIILSDNKLFPEAFKILLKDLSDIKQREDKKRLIEAAFRKNIKEAVEVYKMYEDMINEEVREYVIKTLKQTKLKIYTEEELKEREDKGKKEGIKEGIKEGKERGKAELIIRLLNKKIGKLPPHYEEKIINLGENILTDMADKIFEINDLKDIDKYI